MTRTLQISERITIAKLIEKLQTVQFDKLTYKKYQELFTGHDLQGLQDVKSGLKDLFIDDYIFTVYQPSDNKGSNDIQANGTIKQVDNLFFLEVTYSVN